MNGVCEPVSRVFAVTTVPAASSVPPDPAVSSVPPDPAVSSVPAASCVPLLCLLCPVSSVYAACVQCDYKYSYLTWSQPPPTQYILNLLD